MQKSTLHAEMLCALSLFFPLRCLLKTSGLLCVNVCVENVHVQNNGWLSDDGEGLLQSGPRPDFPQR